MNGKLILCLAWLPVTALAKGAMQKTTASVKLNFEHSVNNKPLVFNTGIYKDANNDSFTVSMFKYYISNISFVDANGAIVKEVNSYHLVNAAKPATTSFNIDIPEGAYKKIRFMLGVDSLHNVSGAQDGALDPINAMFWDWNTGYIMLKMEGKYLQNKNAEVAYHLGGYGGKDKAIRWIELTLPKDVIVDRHKAAGVQIGVDMDAMFAPPHMIDFAKVPVVTSQSKESAEIADNCVHLFTIKKIVE